MDLDGTLVNSEWLAKDAYNFGFKEVLGRPLCDLNHNLATLAKLWFF